MAANTPVAPDERLGPGVVSARTSRRPARSGEQFPAVCMRSASPERTRAPGRTTSARGVADGQAQLVTALEQVHRVRLGPPIRRASSPARGGRRVAVRRGAAERADACSTVGPAWRRGGGRRGHLGFGRRDLACQQRDGRDQRGGDRHPRRHARARRRRRCRLAASTRRVWSWGRSVMRCPPPGAGARRARARRACARPPRTCAARGRCLRIHARRRCERGRLPPDRPGDTPTRAPSAGRRGRVERSSVSSSSTSGGIPRRDAPATPPAAARRCAAARCGRCRTATPRRAPLVRAEARSAFSSAAAKHSARQSPPPRRRRRAGRSSGTPPARGARRTPRTPAGHPPGVVRRGGHRPVPTGSRAFCDHAA